MEVGGYIVLGMKWDYICNIETRKSLLQSVHKW